MVNQTRFFLTERAKIDENIANGTINAHDLVLTSDTHELIFVDTDTTYFAVTTTDAGLNELVDSVKAEIEELREEAKNSLVTGVKGSNETTYRKGDVNIGTHDIGLDRVENYTQVRGLFSGTTEGHVVTWGRNGYIVADGGHTLEADVPEDAVFTDTTYENATETAAGLMSAADKVKLDNLENGETYTEFEGYSSTGGKHGLVPAPASASEILTSTGSWLKPRLRSYKVSLPDGRIGGQQIVLELLDANNNAVFWSVPLDLTNYDTGKGDLAPATSTMPGIMSSSDKIKLDGIETGAQKNVVYENATTEAAGLMSAEDKTKLDSIDAASSSPYSIPLEETTWAALVAKRDAGTLIPGMQYRITDYVCTTTQDESRAVSHPFDIIVTADDEGTLNENARAVKKDGDTYYQYADLSAWQLKYCIDNDTTRFNWADTTNGHGVVYYMKDDHNNECPYDFKQIQFKRYKITACTVSWLVGKYTTLNHGDAITGIDEQNPVWCYTFSYDPNKTGVMSDSSVMEFNAHNGTDVSGNIINALYDYQDPDKRVGLNVVYLNNIVFIGSSCHFNTFGNSCQYNTFGNNCSSNTFGVDCNNNTFDNNCQYNTFGNGCSSNTFGGSCSSNTFGGSCSSNTFGYNCSSNTFGNGCNSNMFGDGCSSNTFGGSCSSNTFGYNCSSNTFRNSCSSNTFGGNCSFNTFGDDYSSNTFGDGCQYNTFGDYCQYNTFGNYCNSNMFGNNCSSNTFRNSCNSNTFGNNCSSNTFGDGCQYNTFGGNCYSNTLGDYCYSNTFGDECRYIDFSAGAQSQKKRYYNVLDGVQGSSSSHISITGTNGNNFVTYVGKNGSGVLKTWVPADLVQ